MNRGLAGVGGYRFERTLRRRVGSAIGVVLLVGLLGGVALGALAAARRTQSAFPAYLASTHASDLQFQTFDLQNFFGADNTKLAASLSALPGVAHVASAPTMLVLPRQRHRTKAPSLFGDVSALGSVAGMYFDQDRVSVVQGTMANPARVDEMVASVEAAKLLGFHVGERVPLNVFTRRQVAAVGNLPPGTDPPVAQPTVTLVGLVVFSSQVVRDDVDKFPTFVVFTPAFTHRYATSTAIPTFGLRLEQGTTVTSVEHSIVGLLPRGSVYNFHVTAVAEGQVLRASRPEAIALAVFGLIAALAALLVAGLAIRREAWARRAELDVLRALGADRSMVALDAALLPLVATLLGSLLAVGVAIALSPLAPLGPVREVYPSPGVAFDWTVLAGGFAFFAGVLGLLVVGLAVPRRRRDDRGTARDSTIATAAAHAGFSVPAVVGLHFSLERDRGRSGVPVRSALLGAVLAVVVIVTTVTFASSLATLDSHPALYGWNWDYAINSPASSNVPPIAARLLDRDPDVAAWTSYDLANTELDGHLVPTLLSDTHAELSPPILSGHALEATDEVVLGEATLEMLHKHVGDTVTLTYGTKLDAPVYVPATTLHIVGTATMPAIGSPGTVHPSIGSGALISRGVEPTAFRRALAGSDPNQNGPAIEVVRLRSGVSATAGRATLEAIAAAATHVEDVDPDGGGPPFQVLSVQRPAEIVIYQTTGATPLVLAGGLALGAIAGLGLTLSASVRRRRRDLALLKTLGFSRRQLSATLAWQASVAAVVGVLLGMPIGIALGRWLWILFARAIYVVPIPTVPVGDLVVIAIGALVLANVVAVLPGQSAARTSTALALRAE